MGSPPPHTHHFLEFIVILIALHTRGYSNYLPPTDQIPTHLLVVLAFPRTRKTWSSTTQDRQRNKGMIIRAMKSSGWALLAGAAAFLLSSPDSQVCGAPVVVTDYNGLVATVGSNNDYDTGERFNRYPCLNISPWAREKGCK